MSFSPDSLRSLSFATAGIFIDEQGNENPVSFDQLCELFDRKKEEEYYDVGVLAGCFEQTGVVAFDVFVLAVDSVCVRMLDGNERALSFRVTPSESNGYAGSSWMRVGKQFFVQPHPRGGLSRRLSGDMNTVCLLYVRRAHIDVNTLEGQETMMQRSFAAFKERLCLGRQLFGFYPSKESVFMFIVDTLKRLSEKQKQKIPYFYHHSLPLCGDDYEPVCKDLREQIDLYQVMSFEKAYEFLTKIVAA